MNPKGNTVTCLSCGRADGDFPLVTLRMQGKDFFICPQCLPALIHHPDRLTEKLLGLSDENA